MMNKNLQVEKEKDFSLMLKEDFLLDYQEYSDSCIKELAKLTRETEEEVKQDLFGKYMFEDDNLHKRPLSKLIRDISKELGLV